MAQMKSLLSLVCAALLTAAGHTTAQDYPGRGVRIILPFPPGGGTDILARVIGEKVAEHWGQPVVIENRPGATGTTAAAQVAQSPGDGYTLMMGHVSVNAIAPALFANLGYDVIRDFAPVGIAASVPHLVTVHPSFQVNSLRELVAQIADCLVRILELRDLLALKDHLARYRQVLHTVNPDIGILLRE